MRDDRVRTWWSGRALLAFGILVGLVLAAYFLVPSSVQPRHRPLGRDFYIYHATARAFLGGDPFVGHTAAFGGRTLSYVYPPVTILAFVPYALLNRTVAFAVHAAVGAAAMLGVGALTVRTVEGRRGRLPTIDRVLIGGFCLASAFSMMAVGLGQVDPLIALCLAGAFVAVERGRESVAGSAIAIAGVFKLVPALAGLWLAYRRAWSGVVAAVGTGVASVIASLLLFGVDAHLAFMEHVLAVRSRLAAFDSTSTTAVEFSVTLAQPLAVLFPGLDSVLYPLVTVAILGPVLAVLYRRSGTTTDSLVAFLGTLCVVLLVSPASNFTWVVYLYFPLLSLLYLLEEPTSRWFLLAGLGLLSVPIQKYQPRAVAELLGYADAYAATAGPVVETVLSFGTVPLYGILCLLAACVAFHRLGDPERGVSPEAIADD